MFAPIALSTYKRIGHLQASIRSLLNNTISSQCHLFIFSDGPKPGDEKEVRQVRDFIHKIRGFKEVTVFEREINSRIDNNRGGMKYILENYGRVIFLEEDIVTAPGFLIFMNNALDFYIDCPDVISVTGYCPPISMPRYYNKHAFFLKRFNGWGFGTWSSKFDPFAFDVDCETVLKELKNKLSRNKLSEYGEDLERMILREASGIIDALDVKVIYHQFKYNKYTLFPVKSLVNNIGHDGTGVHCGVTNAFHHQNLWTKTSDFDFPVNLFVDEQIKSANYQFRKIKKKSLLYRFKKIFANYLVKISCNLFQRQ